MQYHDRDDLDYYGIKDIESSFDDNTDNDESYCKPILVKTSFKNNYKCHESREDKEKTVSKTISLQHYAISKWFNRWS